MSKSVYKLNGQTVTPEEFRGKRRKKSWLKKRVFVPNTYTEHDPLVSDGCGVMKSQVGETRQMIRQHNIQGAAVLDNGQVRFTSRGARKEFLKQRGLVDNDASYGD